MRRARLSPSPAVSSAVSLASFASSAAIAALLGAGGLGCGGGSDDAAGSSAASAATAITEARDVEADVEGPARRAQLAALVAAHLAPGAPAGGDPATADRDDDGIADALEEDLLRRYRPFYRFSKKDGNDEDRRPADAVEELRHAQLKTMKGDGDGVTDPVAGCGRAGDQHLDPPASLYTCRSDDSLVTTPSKTKLCLNIENDRYPGVALDEAKTKATGLYGHVAPDTIDGHPAYKIEYWQFYAFNNQDITVLGLGSYGDHEGDWTSVQLWFDRTAGRVARVLYLVHGKTISFEVPAASTSCRSCTAKVHGAHFDPNVGNFYDDSERPKYNDNQAEFFVDAQGFKHVVVYVEHGGHESWAGSWGHAQIDVGPIAIHLNPHGGDGTSYLVPDVQDRPLNMGEVDKPLTVEGSLILPFNGFWGSTNDTDFAGPVRRSPVGPALHCSWKWTAHGPLAGCEG